MRALVVCTVILFSLTANAQTWRSVGTESFERVWVEGDSALIISTAERKYLRSTDAGICFSNYELRIANYEWHDTAYRHIILADGTQLLLDDSSDILLSRDGGSSWERVFYPFPPPSPLPSPQGERGKNNISLHAICVMDHRGYAVGEPGLVLVSDTTFEHWGEIHRAPYVVPSTEYRVSSANSNPLPFTRCPLPSAQADFWSAQVGAIAVHGEIFITRDSCVTWQCVGAVDTAITSMMMTSDSSVLVGSVAGVYNLVWRQAPSPVSASAEVRQAGAPAATRPILFPSRVVQVGWTDKWLGQIYIVTDSNVYFTNTSLGDMSAMPFTLPAGEHVRAATFPDKYDGYLISDTITRHDTTLTTNYRTFDTTLYFDTSRIYRTTDGGGSWSEMYAGPYRLNNIYFFNAKAGFVCGDRGTMLRSGDSGMRWSLVRLQTTQNLNAIKFISDWVGYGVGDSGVVGVTTYMGYLWHMAAPDPLFTHPATSYCAIAFPDPHSVVVVGSDRAYRQPIRDPMRPNWRFRRARRTELKPLVVTVAPNPTGGVVHIHITSKNPATNSDAPTLSIIDAAGRTIISDISCTLAGQNEWNAEADMSELQTALYVAVATLFGASGRANIVVQH